MLPLSSNSPGALESALKQSDPQQNANFNASLCLGGRFSNIIAAAAPRGSTMYPGVTINIKETPNCFLHRGHVQDLGTENIKRNRSEWKGLLHNQSRQREEISALAAG